MHKQTLCLLTLIAMFSGGSAEASETLRIESLYRCADWVATEPQWCVRVRGMSTSLPTLVFEGVDLPAASVTRQAQTLHFRMRGEKKISGPLWLRDGSGQLERAR